MKRTLYAAIILLSCVLTAHAQSDQKVYLAEVTDFSQMVSYRIMGKEDYKSLRKQIMTKNRLLAKSLKLAKKEWESSEDSDMAKKRFPVNVVKPAKVKSLGLFGSQEKAQAKLDDIMTDEQRKEEQHAKKVSGIERQIVEIKKHLKATQADGQMDSSRKATQIRNLEMQIESLEEELAEREAKDKEKEYNKEQAQAR